MMMPPDCYIAATYPELDSGGDTRIVVKWVKVCVCGADALDDPAIEDIACHLCSACWLHLHGQAHADAMWDAIYE